MFRLGGWGFRRMQAEQRSKEARPRNSKGQQSPAVRAVPGPLKVSSKVSSSSLQDGYGKQNRTLEEAGPPQRRFSSGSVTTPRPPLAPQKAVPATATATAAAAATTTSESDRRSSGPELRPGEDLSKRRSQRYSLTSNATRSTRNSNVHDMQQPHRSQASSITSSSEEMETLGIPRHQKEAARAASQLRNMVLNGGKSVTSSFESTASFTKRDSHSSFISTASRDRSIMSSGKKEKTSKRLTSRILSLFRYFLTLLSGF
jgi:hypothetical protein